MTADPRPPGLHPAAPGEPPRFQVSNTQLLLDKRQAATVLNLSVSTIDRLVKRGELRCVRPGGYVVRFRHEDLREYVRRLAHNQSGDAATETTAAEL